MEDNMENNNNENVNVNENEKSVDDFIQEVNDLKANSVSKEEYNKVVEEKKTLMKALIDGNTDGLDLPTNNSNEDIEKRITNKDMWDKILEGFSDLLVYNKHITDSYYYQFDLYF